MKKFLAILFVTALLIGGAAAGASASKLSEGGTITLMKADPGTGGH